MTVKTHASRVHTFNSRELAKALGAKYKEQQFHDAIMEAVLKMPMPSDKLPLGKIKEGGMPLDAVGSAVDSLLTAEAGYALQKVYHALGQPVPAALREETDAHDDLLAAYTRCGLSASEAGAHIDMLRESAKEAAQTITSSSARGKANAR